MPVGKHVPHFTVNTKWKIVHRWTYSWTWSSSWHLLCFLQREGDSGANIHHIHQLKSLFHLNNSLLILPFSSFPFIYTCETWDPIMVWHLLITLLVALTILGIRKIKLHGEREQLQTLFLLPCPVISQHITSASSAHLLLGWYFQRLMSWGTLLGVSCCFPALMFAAF